MEICEIRKRINALTRHNFNYKKEYVYLSDFRTQYSKDVKYESIIMAEKLLDRQKAKNALTKVIGHQFIADEIEQGLYEFSLIHVTVNNVQPYFVQNIYNDKLNDLCVNLDIHDSHIENKSLLPAVLSGALDPFFLAFMSPEQLHLERWIDVINKHKRRDETLSNLQTTDLYRCSKCGERKMKVSQMQLRSADEPMTTILTCLVCYKTFTKN